ncbi:DUF2550 family protein [Actinomycetaceae bacterium MB13-C1-2]|nr:DUF2550 family protein [Actinomycetaceae bacterium MB13-C1-2]
MDQPSHIVLYIGPIAVVVLVVLLVVLIRMTVLNARSGSFPAFLLVKGRWVRGIAEYGSSNLSWRRRIGLSSAPSVLLARRHIDVVDSPEQWYQSSLVVVTLKTPTDSVSFALRSGDAAGLIAWIDSSPPGT